MSRSKSDPRIARVLAALDEMQRYDDARRAKGEAVHEGEADVLVHHLMFGHREHTFDDWQAKHLRALVVAACRLAPSADLDLWAKNATEMLDDHSESLVEYAREDAEQEARTS